MKLWEIQARLDNGGPFEVSEVCKRLLAIAIAAEDYAHHDTELGKAFAELEDL